MRVWVFIVLCVPGRGAVRCVGAVRVRGAMQSWGRPATDVSIHTDHGPIPRAKETSTSHSIMRGSMQPLSNESTHQAFPQQRFHVSQAAARAVLFCRVCQCCVLSMLLWLVALHRIASLADLADSSHPADKRSAFLTPRLQRPADLVRPLRRHHPQHLTTRSAWVSRVSERVAFSHTDQ